MEENDTMDRRRFVRLLATGAAVAAAAPLVGAGAAESAEVVSSKTPPARERPVTAAMRKEIEVQKKSVTDMLNVIRAYELPAGSPPAPIFRSLRARRNG